nr:nucleotide-binding alpha-beta plait domain-containing protein [Tanacetum cinerariifolium]
MGDSGWTEIRRKNVFSAKQRGNFPSKEDDVARISTSVFISNIPDSITAKDLFHACNQYGHVVDSFIPFKRDKNEEEADDELYSSDGSDIKRHDEEEVHMSEKNADNDDEVDVVQDTIFEGDRQGNNQDDGKKSEHPNVKSEYPFGLYDLLNKANRNDSNSDSS